MFWPPSPTSRDILWLGRQWMCAARMLNLAEKQGSFPVEEEGKRVREKGKSGSVNRRRKKNSNLVYMLSLPIINQPMSPPFLSTW
mmetsp:Transcript_43996/g.68824  ORF Transcript_43996/g.68824 Transcript_43996/m.68824 type:complete len:85 (-) Transcript_43996:321-575(-)